MSIVRTFNGGHVATGSRLSITNGTCATVRGYILAREEQDKLRRRAYRKARVIKPGSKGDTFKEYKPT